MKLFFLLFNRIESHFKIHKFPMFIFFVGIFTSVLFFTYFYSEFVKGVLMGDGATESMATCRTYVGPHVTLKDERFRQLEEKYKVTYGVLGKIDSDKCDDVIDKRLLPESSHIYIMARKNNQFDEGVIWGNCDVNQKKNAIVLSSTVNFINSTKLRESGTGRFNIEGYDFDITGIHATANDACVNYEFLYDNDIYIDRIDVMTYDYKNIASLQSVIDELNELFPVASAQPLMGGYIDEIVEKSRNNLLRGIGILALAFFSFLFVLKYIFDMDKKENIIERVVGASNGTIGIIAYLEIMLLTIVGTLFTFGIHSMLYKSIFRYISDFDMGVNLIFSDYVVISAFIVMIMTVAAIPLICGVCYSKLISVD